jgi:hypothetical protein
MTRRSLWEADDLAQWLLLSIVGVLVVFAGWYILSSHDTFAGVIPGLDIAIVGVLLIGYAQATFVLRGYRTVQDRTAALFPRAQSEGAAREGAPVRGATAGLVALDGLRFFHRPDCPLVQGKPYREVTVPLGSDERRACPVCVP